MRNQSYFTDPVIQRCFKANNDSISACIFTPDMRQCISGTEDGSIFVWNFKPEKRPFKFIGHKGTISELAIHPEGNLIASASLDETVRLWSNSVRGKCEVLKCHPSPTRTIDFSSTGKFLLTGANDKTIKIFSLFPRIKFVSSFTGHTNWVKCARFSPDNRLIGSCSDDHTVRIFDVEQKTNVFNFLDHTMNVNTCRFSPDGTIIASAGDDAKIKLFDIRSRRLIQHYDAHSAKINCISFHPNGNHLISCGDDANIKIWDLKMGQILYTVHGHNGKIKCVNFSEQGDHFCSGGDDSILMIWKSNICNMDEEFNTLGLGQTQTTKISNKTKIRLQESNENLEKKRMDLRETRSNKMSETRASPYKNTQKAEYLAKADTHIKAKSPVIRYKVTCEKGINDLYKKNQEELKISNDNTSNVIKNASMMNNMNTFSGSNQMLGESMNSVNQNNKSSYSLAPDLANSFDKMLNQLDLITKTMKIMDQRIQMVEGQVEELYRTRKIQETQSFQGTMNSNKMYISQNDENLVKSHDMDLGRNEKIIEKDNNIEQAYMENINNMNIEGEPNVEENREEREEMNQLGEQEQEGQMNEQENNEMINEEGTNPPVGIFEDVLEHKEEFNEGENEQK